MQYLQFDNLNKKVSKIALGTTYFGANIGEKLAFELLDTYFEAGGTTIDTARLYTDGVSESIVGKWLKLNKVENEAVVIAKGLHNDKNDQSRFTQENFLTDINKSQDSLGLNSFDFWLFHRDDLSLSVHQIIDFAASLVTKGVIKNLGCSNWETKRVESVKEKLKANEIQFSLAKTTPVALEDEALVCMTKESKLWYKKNNFPVFAFSSQAKGFFSKGLDKLSIKGKKRFLNDYNIKLFDRVNNLAKEKSLNATAIAIAYITSQSFPTVALIGPSSVEQLKETLAAANVVLDKNDLDYLDGVS
jgi:aryl-alcohol dehydrogenase-like predicted oxidoreductase